MIEYKNRMVDPLNDREIRLIRDLVWPELAFVRMQISLDTKKSTDAYAYKISYTVGHFNSSFVLAVGHLPVCLQTILMPGEGHCWK